MSIASAPLSPPAGIAFDSLAATYNASFTDSLIGRAQRDSVWHALQKIFRSGDRVLEINCGTGEDAFFLSQQGVSVYACDASVAMINTAIESMEAANLHAPVIFRHLPTEQIAVLQSDTVFDGGFSNFSGLNCVNDLSSAAKDLAALIRPAGSLVLCLSTRICWIEIAYYLLRGHPRKALRRCGGQAIAQIGGHAVDVYYPTLTELKRAFAPHFQLREVTGVGVIVPPSYLEAWARRHPRLLRMLCSIEHLLAPLPVLRITGDHVLLYFRRETA